MHFSYVERDSRAFPVSVTWQGLWRRWRRRPLPDWSRTWDQRRWETNNPNIKHPLLNHRSTGGSDWLQIIHKSFHKVFTISVFFDVHARIDVWKTHLSLKNLTLMLWPWGVEAETARDIPGQIRCGTGAGELQVVSLDHWTCFSGFRSDRDCDVLRLCFALVLDT